MRVEPNKTRSCNHLLGTYNTVDYFNKRNPSHTNTLENYTGHDLLQNSPISETFRHVTQTSFPPLYLSPNRNHAAACADCLKLLYTGEDTVASAARHPGTPCRTADRRGKKQGKAHEVPKLRCAHALQYHSTSQRDL